MSAMHMHASHATHGHGLDRGSKALARLLLLSAMTAYFAYLWTSGTLGNYISMRFAWLAILGGVLLLGLTVNAAIGLARGAEGLDFGYHSMGHVKQPPTWFVFAVVAVPLALGLVIPSRPLGAGAISGDVSSDPAPTGAAIPSTDSLQWTILDWLRVFSTGQGDRFSGRQADVTGFVYRRDGDPAGYFRVTRFVMVCCSADAYAVGIPVAWSGADAIPTDTWARVKGSIQVGDFRGQRLPIVTAESVDTTVARPNQAYLYQ